MTLLHEGMTALPTPIAARPALPALLMCVGLLMALRAGHAATNLVSNGDEAPHRGVYQVALGASGAFGNPYFDVVFQVTFTRPNESQVTVDGFYDGGKAFKARAYCDTVGEWKWHSASSNAGLNGKSGAFTVVASSLKGKLRRHPADPRQFAYDNGEWFLHIGDTAYRYVVATEPKWQEYIDQAARMGATKIRTWFCQGRSDVQVLLANGRTELNLAYWQEIDRRVTYALDRHPHVILKLIPYGEDHAELRRYREGDEASRLIARYAQARFSAFPNVHWCVSNDREIVREGEMKGRRVAYDAIDQIARDMAAREPWGTLLTNHQSRFTGYSFVDEPWSDIVTVEDMDQVHGGIILEYREKATAPVVLDEDRYEHHREPKHARYFFRRLMWGCLLSGGHTTYGGLRTYEAYDGDLRGVQGYYDACEAGKLADGAHDFVHIHKFFADSGLTLVNMVPGDPLVGGDPNKWKCIHDHDTFVIYLANPTGTTPEDDTPMPDAKIRTGLIGGGGNMRAHVTGRLSKIPEVEIVAVTEPSEAALGRFLEAASDLKGIPTFSEHEKMLDAVDMDAVVISTPHTTHLKQITDSLEHDLHVLVEKPMVCTVADAKKVIELRDKTGKVVEVAYQRHFHGAFRYAREYVQSGKLGPIHFISAFQCQNWWHEQRAKTWRADPDLSGGGQPHDATGKEGVP